MATSSPPSVLDGCSKEEEEEIVVGKKKKEDQKILRRKYSAIRDYPPGCGRFTPKLQQHSDYGSEICDDHKVSVLEEEEEERMVGKRKADNLMEGSGDEIVPKRRNMYFAVVRDYPPGVGPNQHIIADSQDSESCGCDDTESSVLDGCRSEDEDDDYDYDDEEEVEEEWEEEEEEEALVREMKEVEEEEARMVSRKNREGLLMEEGGGNEIVGDRRKYFAVRDYPPGVGPNQYQYITSTLQHSGSCGAINTKSSALYGCCCEDGDYDEEEEEEEEARLVEEEEARVVEEEWKKLEEEKKAMVREMNEEEEEEEEVCM